MEKMVLLAAVLCLGVAGGIVAVEPDEKPVRASNVSCETGGSVVCEATLHNTDTETGYNLAVKMVGYDANGEVVTAYVNDATGAGDGIASIPPGGTEPITISVSATDRVTTGDVLVVAAEPVAD